MYPNYNNYYPYMGNPQAIQGQINQIRGQMQQQYPQYNQPSFNQPYNPPQPTNAYEYVNGIEGAKAYPMQSNQNVLLMDSDNPIFYMKSSDMNGKATLKHFRFEEFDPNSVVKEEVAGVGAVAYSEILADIQEMKSNIDTIIKYIQPKKATPKKAEVKANE